MPYYNTTNLTSSNNLVEITKQVNLLSGSIFGFTILIAFIVILLVAFRNRGTRTTMPIIAFLSTLLSMLLVAMELLPDMVMYVMIVLTAASVLASIFINPEG